MIWTWYDTYFLKCWYHANKTNTAYPGFNKKCSIREMFFSPLTTWPSSLLCGVSYRDLRAYCPKWKVLILCGVGTRLCKCLIRRWKILWIFDRIPALLADHRVGHYKELWIILCGLWRTSVATSCWTKKWPTDSPSSGTSTGRGENNGWEHKFLSLAENSLTKDELTPFFVPWDPKVPTTGFISQSIRFPTT